MNAEQSYTLSDQDISDFLEQFDITSQMIPYNQLKNYKKLDEIFQETNNIILHYPFEGDPQFGHWAVIIRKSPSHIYYFDSYGKPIDEYFINKPYFSKIALKWLEDPKNTLEYNHTRFQSNGDDINTCGRWAIAAILFSPLTLKQFTYLFLGNKKYSSDDIVTFLTQTI